MSENPKVGRFQNVAQAPAKVSAATRRLAIQLFSCVAVNACIVLAHATGDMSTRLSLGLTGVVLVAGGFCIGAWHQFRARKEDKLYG